MHSILIAEDEPRIAAFIQKGLKAHGFTTYVANDAQYIYEVLKTARIDLLILDLGLPGKDGLTVLEELRGQGEQFPIIILTARDSISNKVAGLEGGADDYMTKPFRFEELLARVRVRLRSRTSDSLQSDQLLRVGNISLNLWTRTAKVGDRTVDLPAREFTLAETFLRQPGQVLSRQQLLDRVWGYDYDPGSNIVDVYVGYLRKKIGNHAIETIRGVGYRLRTEQLD
ncbi:MAG: response regulator transcription factor [Synechococcales cyanobacterium K44_A2020_017]|jgi:DNA-binding response OmpR family regulator|nr:response regulator transcription factor [Synechococcales cyanobacterium K32_A2020_035]MBF2096601.1 response regulator transcription factor [Synechococcales cyanobacterium K44_A2020_017]